MANKKQKKLQRKAQAVWRFKEDGIWDIWTGLVAVWVGLIYFLKWPFWGLLGLLPLGLIPYLLKKWLVIPRAMSIKIGKSPRRAWLEMGLIMLVVFMVVIWIAKDEPGLRGVWLYLRDNSLMMTGILFGMLSFYLAYALAFPRLYLHGLLVLVAFLVEAWLVPSQPFGFAMWAGLIIVFSGMYLMFKFLRSHPSA